jgi:hypothetical protein
MELCKPIYSNQCVSGLARQVFEGVIGDEEVMVYRI